MSDAAPWFGAPAEIRRNDRGRTPGPNAAAEALELQGICKSFGAVLALQEVDLAVRSGEFVTLLGPSGCGKTTLLRVVAGLELPDAGRVLLRGADVTRVPANRRPVNTVFQNYALFPHLDVFENIAFGLRARRFDPAEVRRRVEEALSLLEMTPLARRQVHELSGGEKQRVALARALVNEPEVLLLDEPLSALDARLRAELQLELRRLQRRLGKTFVLVTHDQDEAMTVSDRIFVMRAGRMVQSGTPREVYDRPVNRFVAAFLGSANLIAGRLARHSPAQGRDGGGRGGDASVQTELGALTVRLPPDWVSGTLAIRPECVRLGQSRAAVNAFHGTVREVIYRGDHADVFVEPGPLRVRISPAAAPQQGEEVWLELPPEHLEALVD